MIEHTEATENAITIIADGAYNGEETTKLAAEKNIILLTTGLLGRKPKKILAVIRNKYGVDKMPVRGKLRTKQFFGFKVAALNFSKLLRFIQGKEKCRAFLPL